MGEVGGLKPVMIPWIAPSDPRNRLGATMYTESPELRAIYAKIPALYDERPRKPGRKPGTTRYTSAEDFLQDILEALARLKGHPKKVYISTLAGLCKVSRSTFYKTAKQFDVDVRTLIREHIGDQTYLQKSVRIRREG